MRIGIFYFSGTGNTKYVAYLMAQYFMERKDDVTISSIEDVKNIEDYDVIAIGGPIYAGNIPEKMIRWILRNIPNTSSGKAIVFTTSAGLLNAFGVKSMAKKLSKRGYNIIGKLSYQLPRNFYFDKYEQTSAEDSLSQYEYVESQVAIDMSNIINLEGEKYNEKVLGIDLLAETMSVMTRFMGKSYSVNDDCTKCMKCVKACPTQNIVLKKKISFKWNCMMCTRCIHSCPENAIRYKKNKIEQYSL